MTMQIVQHIELTSTQYLLEFTNIPQDATDLLLVCSVRSSQSFSSYGGSVTQINAQYGDGISLSASGNTPTSSTNGFLRAEYALTLSLAAANIYSAISIYIPNYATSGRKILSIDGVSENNTTSAGRSINVGYSTNTSPVTSIGIGESLIAGSSATLYKITKGSDGTTIAS